ncbi:MAG TPA: flagellar biosynthesis protein FliQ [Bacteroidota bacterium]|nr:flagellar biosynthesis protein FliQ [Bacteroidota bacterium]
MSEEYIVHLFREAFFTILLLSGPVLVLSLLVGLVISVFQAATSIQEFTLTFVPKLLVTAIVIILLLPWMIDVLVSFTQNIFAQIPEIGK